MPPIFKKKKKKIERKKKSEPEKAQQCILVAPEHLPKENKVTAMLNLLLGIKLELPLKIGAHLFRLFFSTMQDCEVFLNFSSLFLKDFVTSGAKLTFDVD